MAFFIPEEKILEIKNSVDIVDFISDAVLLKKMGRNYLGLCPFHSEKTPSFTVSPEKQIFYCFGCGTGGNIFSFLMKREGLSFPEAAKMLAKRYGIDIPIKAMSPAQKKQFSEKELLISVNQDAMNFFRNCLHDSIIGKKAMAYLGNRGITKEVVNKFDLGYAPPGWDNLIKYFSNQRLSIDLLANAGLIVPRKNNGGFYDRFRERIIFPIFDINAQVIGFGGRVMDASLPKYINSPETPVYNKSQSLYGLHFAKGESRKNNSVYIVEGYFDLLSLNQHGIHNVVAILGTALSPEHVRILKGFINNKEKE